MHDYLCMCFFHVCSPDKSYMPNMSSGCYRYQLLHRIAGELQRNWYGHIMKTLFITRNVLWYQCPNGHLTSLVPSAYHQGYMKCIVAVLRGSYSS